MVVWLVRVGESGASRRWVWRFCWKWRRGEVSFSGVAVVLLCLIVCRCLWRPLSFEADWVGGVIWDGSWRD